MILILGGHGFVGSAFVRACESRGLEHVALTRANYNEYVGTECTMFINANGNSRKPLASSDPMADFDASVRSVRQSLVDFRPQRYVFLSSCDVYADCSSPSLTSEDRTIDGAALSAYGFHKYLAETCVRNLSTNWLVVRFGGFVGPGIWKNAIFDILRGGPLWLDPESRLQFMATDAAAAVVLDLVDRAKNEIFNVCGRGTVQLKEVIDAVDRPVEVRPGSPRVTYDVNIEKAASLVEVPETRSAVLDFVRSQPSVVGT